MKIASDSCRIPTRFVVRILSFVRPGRYPAAERRRPLRHSPRFDHGGDEEELPRLRHERDRGARAAGRARRAQAGASAHPLFDARERLRVEQAVPQIGARRRRRHRQISSARRPVDLRRAGAHGAGFFHAPAADRRPGQFRLGRRRCAGGHALHRGAAGEGRRRRWSRTSTRTPSTSRPTTTIPSASRWCCRRAFPICWSMAPAASPSAWRPISRRTISAR